MSIDTSHSAVQAVERELRAHGIQGEVRWLDEATPTAAAAAAALGIEVGATAVLPRTQGFHDLLWSVLVLTAYGVSIWLLAVVTKQMSISVAYAVWSGLGTAAIAAIGTIAFGERIDLVKVTALALIIVGVVVLNLHTTTPH